MYSFGHCQCMAQSLWDSHIHPGSSHRRFLLPARVTLSVPCLGDVALWSKMDLQETLLHFQAQLDRALNNLIWQKVSLPLAGGLD